MSRSLYYTSLESLKYIYAHRMDPSEACNALQPPKLPRSSEVDNEVAIRYFDAYQLYVSTYGQMNGKVNRKKRGSVLSNDNIAPSMSASQRGYIVPAIVRVDSRESNLSYTPPNLPSEYSGLIVGGRDMDHGFCYLGLIQEEHRASVKDRLGRYPTFKSILSISTEMFVAPDRLRRMQISRVAPGHYHVLSGTIMPNAFTTLAAVAQKYRNVADHSDEREDADSMYQSMLRVDVREESLMHAPMSDDILGSSGRNFFGRQYSVERRAYGNGSPSYSSTRRMPSIDSYSGDRYGGDRYSRGSRYEPERYPYGGYGDETRRYDNTSGALPRSYDRTFQNYSRMAVAEPRGDRSYHHIRPSTSAYDSYSRPYATGYTSYSRPRSPEYTPRRDYARSSRYAEYDDYDPDSDLQRALRESESDFTRSSTRRDSAFEYSDMQREIDDMYESTVPQTGTRRNVAPAASFLSSDASTASIRITQSLENIMCSICQDNITDGGGILRCGHVFHHNCVDPWIAQSGTCPTCRVTL